MNSGMLCSGGGGSGSVANGSMRQGVRRRRCLALERRGKMLLAGVSVVEERGKNLSDVRVHAATERE